MAKAGKIPSFREFLYKISQSLSRDDIESLKFVCSDELTTAKLGNIKNAMDLFVAIGEVVPDEAVQLQYLKRKFETIGRHDLKFNILQFEKSRKGRER